MPRRVLVADDDAGIRTLLRALLERRGVAVELVADGDAALARIGSKTYDAILLDLMMPAANGFEIVRRLQDDHPHVLDYVIVVTAAAERTLRQFDASAVRRVFRKPFDIDELVDEVLAAFA
ncbi:MAG TPA: response regulator [Thermoanaerobaculia bacterium]|nr:response regulator [Thermoanaerobaculia bacterium]